MMYERPDLPISVPGFTIGTDDAGRNTRRRCSACPKARTSSRTGTLLGDRQAARPQAGVLRHRSSTSASTPADDRRDAGDPRCADSQVTLDAAQGGPGDSTRAAGSTITPSAVVQPARPEANGRFDVMPADVAEELRRVPRLGAGAARRAGRSDHSHLLISRRMNRVMNSLGSKLQRDAEARSGQSPPTCTPTSSPRLSIAAGRPVEIASEHGRIETVAQPDKARAAGRGLDRALLGRAAGRATGRAPTPTC